jgi:hypothetical protein
MKGIYFLILTFILILIVVGIVVPKSHPCLSQQVLYFGTPQLIREGFNASEYSYCFPDEGHISNNYPYFAATHPPTNHIINHKKVVDTFNKKISNEIVSHSPKGTQFTLHYKCRNSPISYNNPFYRNCGPYSQNRCNL